MTTSPPILNAMTFDIEDWFHMVEIPAVSDPATWPAFPSLVVDRTRLILRVLDERKTQATFFVLGWVADRYPDIVREIAAAGHEVASHGYMHQPVWQQTPAQFKDDLSRSLEALAKGTSAPIRGYRAPTFSIIPGTEWAFDALADLGFTYDASLFPAPRGHGGYACARGPHTITTPTGKTLTELPMSVASIGFGPIRKTMCYCGGGYLRLLPQRLIDQGIAQEQAAGRPTVVYLHPRDFAIDCPRVPMPLNRRFRCYVGLSTTRPKLEALLRGHRWGTCSRIVATMADAQEPDKDTPAPKLSALPQ